MPPIQAWKSLSMIFTGLRRRPLRCDCGERLQDLSFKHLDLLLRRLQLLLAEPGEFEAALVGGERLLQRQLAAFHAGHDFLQLRERLFESLLACSCAAVRAGNGLAHRLVRYCFSSAFTTESGAFSTRCRTSGPFVKSSLPNAIYRSRGTSIPRSSSLKRSCFSPPAPTTSGTSSWCRRSVTTTPWAGPTTRKSW